MTPDPYRASGGPADPGSWNRYAYVQGDPVNFYDPSGQLIAVPLGDGGGGGFGGDPFYGGGGFGGDPFYVPFPGPVGGGGVSPDPGGGGGGGGPSPERPIDATTSTNARGLLKQRLADFKDSNCWKVLGHEGVRLGNILDNYSNENFYDVRSGSQFANLTLPDVGILSSDPTTLNAMLGSADAKTVGSLGSARTTAVLLGTQYFFSGNTDEIRQNSLLNEMLHALGGFKDTQILTNKYFLQNGLIDKSVGKILDTSGITDWLSRDCKK